MGDVDSLQARLEAALHDVVAGVVGSEMVTGWAIQIATIDEAGQEGMWLCHSPGQSVWTTLGFLDYAGVRARKAAADD